MWLSPLQVIFLPVGEKHFDYCRRWCQEYSSQGARCAVDDGNETLSSKIRAAHQYCVPYPLVVGDVEVSSMQANLRQKLAPGEYVNRPVDVVDFWRSVSGEAEVTF